MEDDGVNKRSVLRLRMRGHLQPGREQEAIVEVVRAGKWSPRSTAAAKAST